jgi:hypothetical protein
MEVPESRRGDVVDKICECRRSMCDERAERKRDTDIRTISIGNRLRSTVRRTKLGVSDRWSLYKCLQTIFLTWESRHREQLWSTIVTGIDTTISTLTNVCLYHLPYVD